MTRFLILKNILVFRFLSWQRLRYMSMYPHKHCLKRYQVKHFHHDNHAFVISTKKSNDFKLSNLSEWLYVISSKIQLADDPSTPVRKNELYGARFVPGSPETLRLCLFCIKINFRQQNYDSTSWRLRGEHTERQTESIVYMVTLENRPPPPFSSVRGASPCISMDSIWSLYSMEVKTENSESAKICLNFNFQEGGGGG